LKNVGAALTRAFVSSVLTVFVFSVAGWPKGALGAWLGLGVFVVGFVLTAGLQFGFNYLMAAGRLAEEEADHLRVENEQLHKYRDEVEHLRRLQQQQTAVYQEHVDRLTQAQKVVEAQNGVLWGVYREHAEGVQVPVAALMARMETSTQVASQTAAESPS
jgi:hypothetical protein